MIFHRRRIIKREGGPRIRYESVLNLKTFLLERRTCKHHEREASDIFPSLVLVVIEACIPPISCESMVATVLNGGNGGGQRRVAYTCSLYIFRALLLLFSNGFRLLKH